jgi:hypothetical protein
LISDLRFSIFDCTVAVALRAVQPWKEVTSHVA